MVSSGASKQEANTTPKKKCLVHGSQGLQEQHVVRKRTGRTPRPPSRRVKAPARWTGCMDQVFVFLVPHGLPCPLALIQAASSFVQPLSSSPAMPKKKHQAKFAKPQSTAPASLGASASRPIPPASSNHTPPSAPTSSAFASTTSSSGPITLPPNLRQILQIPETPSPLPRRPLRNDANGRRLPPGPRAPQSWSVQRSNLARQLGGHSTDHAVHAEFHQLPGTYAPARSSMTDLLLRKMALEWEFQGVYNQHYLSSLHSRLRSSLIAYIGTADAMTKGGMQILVSEAVNELNNDLLLFSICPLITHSLSSRADRRALPPRLAALSRLCRTPGTRLTRRLCRQAPPQIDTPVASPCAPRTPPLLRGKQLLALAAKIPTLTHLSLAYWPEPSLTPNAKFSTIAGAQGRDVPYSGTGPYSHTVDDDWTEAIILLRRLSKHLYGLEYLDLTGCSAWYSVLTYDQDGDRIDWEGHWGKMTTLRLRYGFPISENTPEADREARAKAFAVAEQVEKRIVGKRAGKGRFITVERDGMERHA
ncbi:conserved hypothetical protein [Verticillium alfalfae VaMs.102]|uniref:Tafazzin n=1 Tax=Verticillium alfalfae (strain VaMs.102 / ATCC MYA-4576 / FGSC 10136) TaxID=526221 RepID=C9S826_VERA1|nr:conserved hypothetical protein [Verticillium alfalfae VaMs.102]EEY14872.1 conserved hypothetical protein [Verticillium alfalfae VaMs.102]